MGMGNGGSVRAVRIFLASPSEDTQAARRAVVATIAELQRDDEFAGRLRLELLRWDDEMRAVMCEADENPQMAICEQIGHPRRCDLLIGLFAHTMGGFLPEREPFGRHSSGRLWHCTEWEVAQALEGKQAGTVKSVWRFRDQRRQPDPPENLSADDEDVYRKRSTDVRRYLEDWKKRDEPMTKGFQLFKDEEDLARQLRTGLRPWLRKHFSVQKADTDSAVLPPPPDAAPNWLADRLDPDQQALLDALCSEPEEITEPDAARLALAERVLKAPVRGLRGYLLSRYARWCSTEGGRLDRRFVRLTLVVNRGREVEGEQFVVQGAPGRFDRLQDLLVNHADAQGWVLVGEPGCGKSTLLQHHELMTARATLRALVADPVRTPERRPEVCIWQRLSDYDADRTAKTWPAPADWLEAQWQAQWRGSGTDGGGLPTLGEMARHLRVRWVLDGFNEVRHGNDAQYDAAATDWGNWLDRWNARQALPQPAPLLSVRTRERADLGRTVRLIDIEQWSDEQMRRYCRQRFLVPEDASDPPLWQHLSGREQTALRALCRLPFNLAAQCTLFQWLGRPARDQAELISGLVWLGLIRDLDKEHLHPAGLLSRHDRTRLIEARDKGLPDEDVLLVPPREGRLLPWLDRQAERMHAQGLAVSASRAQVEQTLAGEAGPPPTAQWLEALLRLGWWDHSGTDRRTGQPLLRFTHQLWQEFFAARHLCDRLDDPQAALPDLSPPALPDLQEAMDALAPTAPLPGPRASHWEEAIRTVLLFGHQDAVAWLEAVRVVNLPMAGRVAVGRREALEKEARGRRLLDGLRAALLVRSRDPAVDLRLRIEAGLVLGELGDPRYEGREGPHGHRYLMPRRWVTIPEGLYEVGRTEGANDEKPVTVVTLDAYQMAWAPVTNAEFRCFVEAGGYDPQAPWWPGEAAQAWLAGGDGQIDPDMRQYLEAVDMIRADPSLLAQLPEGHRPLLQRHSSMPAERVQLELIRERAQLPRDRPGFSLDTGFNQAAQPVVGVCWFEARAYALWLSAQCGQVVRLPVEAEWEVAAAGGAERRRRPHWPHGDTPPDRDQVNHDQTHLWRTSPVGVFPRGDTAPDDKGLSDMAGNVWEWTSSAYTERHNLEALTTVVSDDSARRVVRGGAWGSTPGSCRASYRNRLDPVNRDGALGLRLVRGLGPHSDPCSPDHRASDATPSAIRE